MNEPQNLRLKIFKTFPQIHFINEINLIRPTIKQLFKNTRNLENLRSIDKMLLDIPLKEEIMRVEVNKNERFRIVVVSVRLQGKKVEG